MFGAAWRWLAVLGQLFTILVTHFSLGVDLPLAKMCGVLAGLAAYNLVYEISLRLGRELYAGELFVGLLVDMFTLTAQLYLSGGVSNRRDVRLAARVAALQTVLTQRRVRTYRPLAAAARRMPPVKTRHSARRGK